MTQVTKALEVVLANTYSLYLKTQNYHWNVKGVHFAPLHAMFQGQYEEMAEAIDEIAERIRACGELAPGGFKDFDKLRTLKDAKPGISADKMLKDLISDHKELVKHIKKAGDVATKAKDDATFDMMVERTASHEKTIWMLESSL